MSDLPHNENEPVYKGNHIPLFIKIAWIIFGIWLIGYLFYYAAPDLKQWLSK